MKYVGIDLGGTNIAVGITDSDGNLLAKASTPTEVKLGVDSMIARMAGAVRELIAKTNTVWEDIAAIGIGSPGAVDSQSGTVYSACNLGFDRLPLAARMQALLEKPVFVENDANCAAWAEARVGAARGCRDCVMLTLGTGIGGGIVIDGRLYGGFNNFGGEFGHTVILAGGESCGCGKRGCLEAYASATALVRDTRRAAERDKGSLLWECAKQAGEFNGRIAFEAAARGDKAAMGVVARYIEHLALGLMNVIKIFQPEVIVIGGGISHAGEQLLTPLTERVTQLSYRDYVPTEKRTRIVAAQLGNDAGIVGAALLGI